MSHRLGQVFLKDQNILRKIVSSADITPEDTVVEIGCGEGYLSRELAKHCRRLIIIEIDPQCLAMAAPKLAAFEHVELVQGDFLEVGFDAVGDGRFKVVGNLPYYISTKIIKRIISNKSRIDKAVVMVQKEFAKKLLAHAGNPAYVSFTLYTQFSLTSERLFHVSKNCFRPIPKVDSTVLAMTPRQDPRFPVNDDLFFALVSAAFWTRRKTLQNCLFKSRYLNIDPEFCQTEWFTKNSQKRGEMLDLEAYYTLYKAIFPFIKSYQNPKKET